VSRADGRQSTASRLGNDNGGCYQTTGERTNEGTGLGLDTGGGSSCWHIGGNVLYGVAVGPVRHNDNGPDDHTWGVNSFGPKPGEPGFLAARAEKAGPRTTETGSRTGERTRQLSPSVYSAPVSLSYPDNTNARHRLRAPTTDDFIFSSSVPQARIEFTHLRAACPSLPVLQGLLRANRKISYSSEVE
jgi:hypothetical protein